ncbi:hypothetical protein [Streptomyces shenzhenensis]|uniref:hypothetical protein n=1 Tax=Streptomyces shenzhenensis TaxID=943815 RepID=UPI003F53F558
MRNAGTAASPASTVNASLDGTVAAATVSVSVGKRPMGSYTVSAVDRLTVTQAPGPDLRVTGITTDPASLV